MTIPASKVKALCTEAEAALVKASRKPELQTHSPIELKRLAARARKLFDKWQGLGRGQARQRRQRQGASQTDKNTQIKVEIFQDALRAFEERLAELEAASVRSDKQPARKTKRQRSATHRAARSEARLTLKTKKRIRNQKAKAEPPAPAGPAVTAALVPPSASPAPGQPSAESSPPATQEKPPAPAPSAKKAAASLKPPAAPKKARPLRSDRLQWLQQQSAVTAAKQARLARSGKTTRGRGQLSARVKRTQARRDARG